ncbi:helix-turn-helix transcriptional regulator [Paenibacillus chartarius]|uniref:Helix-turn-helix transcriptional regulator n=1 Tax=Paenibacillus chartarius TaxID=747481 RepID=A0ABV6DL35_9BACL
MNKTDRLMAIVLELQRHGTRRAEDLAALFETSVRTIYRDVQALCEAGVPVVGAPGHGYSLMDGYFLPPVSFTTEEATAMLLGLDYIGRQFDAHYRDKASGARGKIESILPQPVRRDVERVRAGMKLLAAKAGGGGVSEEALASLRRAVLEERRIRFRYVKKAMPDRTDERETVREAEPYGLVLNEGVWMMVAFCCLRREMRHFRVSRMSELEVLEERFARPETFDLQAYRPRDERPVTVRVRIAPELADLVLENNFYSTESAEITEDGLLLTLRVRQWGEALGWVLGWGAGAVVLEPAELRDRVKQELQRGLEAYSAGV